MFFFPDEYKHYKEINDSRKIKYDNLCYAYILIGHTQKLAFISKTNINIAYKCDGYSKTNIIWNKFKFIKWVTSMEL